jgi:hypothetical protein
VRMQFSIAKTLLPLEGGNSRLLDCPNPSY